METTLEEIHMRENFAMLQTAIMEMQPTINRFDELESFILSNTSPIHPSGVDVNWHGWNIFSKVCNDKLLQMRIEEKRCIECGSPNFLPFCECGGRCGQGCEDCGAFVPDGDY